MKLADNNFMVLGCMGAEPDLMPLDPDGSLRQQDGDQAERRLRDALNRNVDNQDTYVRVEKINSEGEKEAGTRAVRNPRRWVCGSEVAQSVLNTIGVSETIAMIQAPAQEARDMYTYMTDRLAPMAPESAPQMDLQQQQTQGRVASRLSQRPQYRPE